MILYAVNSVMPLKGVLARVNILQVHNYRVDQKKYWSNVHVTVKLLYPYCECHTKSKCTVGMQKVLIDLLHVI